MHILLDESPCDIQATSIGEAITAAAEIAEGNGRMIVDVIVDGTPFTQDDLRTESAVSGGADEIHLTSADATELAVRVLADARESLDGLETMQRAAAEFTQAGQRDEAARILHEAFSQWDAVKQAVEMSSHVLGVNLNDLPEADAAIRPLGEQLRTILSALEGADPVGLADTMLYDMPATVQAWRTLTTVLLDRAAPTEPGS